MFTLRLLGGLTLEGPSGPVSGRIAQRRRLALLALLGVAGEKGLSRDKLAGYLWPETDEANAKHLLSDSLYVLRKELGEDALLSSGEFLRLNAEVVECDVAAFEAALEGKQFEAALSVYASPFLDGFYLGGEGEFDAWVERERQRLAEEYATALESAAEQAQAAGDAKRAVEWWKKLAAHDPLNSRVMLRLMEALAAAGDPANALELLRVHELRLRDALGLELPEELQAYAERLRKEPVSGSTVAGEPSRALQEPAPPVAVAAAGDTPTTAQAPTGWRRLVHEIHRRSLWQVLLVYCGGALIAYQAVQALTEGLGLPDWLPGFAVVLFIGLLPVVVATAMVQEGGPLASRDEAPPKAASVVGDAEPAAGRGEVGRLRRLLTWRRAILGGAAAFGLLGIAVSGYMGMRVLGIGPLGTLIAKGVLEERDRIVLADFVDHTGDSVLALTVTEAMRVRLEQSPVVRVADDDHVGRVLQRMEKDPSTPLTYELARELAIREGLKAVVSGAVNPAGSGYVLSARLVAAETGETLESFLETAADPEAIIPAIDRLSAGVRERIGESLTSIQRSEPLAQVTTGSLDALRIYSQARRHFLQVRYERAIPLYQDAIALDSGFAAAWEDLAVAHYNRGERAQAVEAITRAYELPDRLTEPERYTAIGIYHLIVDGDLGQAMDAYRTLVEVTDSTQGVMVLGNFYSHFRDYERANGLYRRALQADSSYCVVWRNLFGSVLQTGKLDEARRTGELWAHNCPASNHHSYQADLAAYRGDYVTAEAHIQARAEAGESRDERLYAQAVASSMRGNLAWLRGQLADARRHFADAVATEETRGASWRLFAYAISLALLHASFLADPGTGIETVEDVLERHPLSELPPLDRPYLHLARFYALLDRPDRARDMLDEYEATLEPRLRSYTEKFTYHRVAGAVALAEGRLEEAIALMRQGDEGSDQSRDVALLGRAYDLAGDADSALAVYERFVTWPDVGRTLVETAGGPLDGFWLVPTCERLAVLYEQSGDTGKAIHYYGRVVDLWKDADPELQPRVEAARRAIAALSPDT